jgi:hypothetical protein
MELIRHAFFNFAPVKNGKIYPCSTSENILKTEKITWTSGSIRSNDASLACHHKLNTIDICGGIIEMNV